MTEQKLCKSCLVSHGNMVCTYQNRHSCKVTDKKKPHHHLICQEGSKKKIVARTTRHTKEDETKTDILVLTSFLDELEIDAVELQEEMLKLNANN